jgi:cation diffusion facilitator CzcD-associated flavoprotein CzcO
MVKDSIVKYKIGIIGAGFAGIIMALNLLRTGRKDFIIFERADGIGGTWRDNVYPGCACDVPSHLYSISSELNPKWSRLYATQPEILAYLQAVAKKNELESYIRYGSDIFFSQFHAEEGYWELRDRTGRVSNVNMLICGIGPFGRPKIPSFPGLNDYQGIQIHSATWDQNCDLAGKKIGVVGSGASAIQLVPALAPQAAELTVFQRTAAWVSPRNDQFIDPKTQAWFERHPTIQRALRHLIFWIMELRGLSFFGNHLIYRWLAKKCLDKLKNEVHDPNVRTKLTPDYQLGCKRVLSSDDYLPTFNRPNVHLETAAIDRFTPDGLVTATGEKYDLDAVVFCTGFEVAEINTDWKIYGLEGRELFEEWHRNGLQSYRGTTIHGYPNLAFILGPNTGLGHNSVVHMMESQMPYILWYLEQLEKGGSSYLNLKSEVQAQYNRVLQTRFAGTVWSSGCQSWYMNAQGVNTTLFPGLASRFRREMRKWKLNEYMVIDN